jgi:DNA repair photolyase
VYPLDPPAVYVHESCLADPRYQRRVDGVLNALEHPVEPVIYRDADVPDLLRQGIADARVPMGTLDEVGDPVLVFNTFRFDGRREERFDALKQQGVDLPWGVSLALLGYGAFNWANYNLEGDPHRHDKVCRPCWRIHLQNGCVHRCLYCGLGGLLVSMVNVEDYCEHLGRIIERHPWQKTFLLDDDGDPMCLEPEHGTLGPLIQYFGTLDARYLVIHTKTWNTDWLDGLAHNGNTILVWSLSGPGQSRLVEPLTGTTEQRIEAARTAQEAGYTIRYKFKPIVPVRTWREDAAEAVRLAFERTKPDMISLCCFMWMGLDEMLSRIREDLLDPEFVQAARDSLDEAETTHAKPFPQAVRAEVYRHYLAEIRKWAPDIPVSLSTENFRIWKELGPEFGFSATDYVCGCGPQSVPCATRLKDHPFQIAVRDDAGLVGTY